MHMKLFDSHTHLNDEQIYNQRQILIENFISQWWSWLIIPWVSEDRNSRWIEIVKEYQDKILIWANIWVHPSEVCEGKIDETSIQSKYDYLKNTIENNKQQIVWIGECWIDLHYPWAEKTIQLQKKLFAMQCELAQEFWLPLIIHSRNDFESTIDVLKDFKTLKLYFHCYWYWPQEIKYIQKNYPNYYIWFAWNVTYPKATTLRDSLKEIELSNLLIETDSPYLAPQKLRWTINNPANVKLIYEFISEFLWIEKEILAQQLESNFMKLFF